MKARNVMKKMKSVFGRPLANEKGIGTVEIVLILAVLVAVVLIFKDAIIGFVTDIVERIFGDANTV